MHIVVLTRHDSSIVMFRLAISSVSWTDQSSSCLCTFVLLSKHIISGVLTC